MKSYKFVTYICVILLVFEHLIPNVSGIKVPASGIKSELLLRHNSSPRSAVVGNKDRYSKSASTLIPSIAAAASTASAAQVSRRNSDLWYLEQSVVSYLLSS